MVALLCALVGEEGDPFLVRVDQGCFVDELKDAIKAKNPRSIPCDARKLKLYLAKKDGNTWLESSADDAKKLKNGEKTPLIEALTHEDNKVDATSNLEAVLEGMPEPQFLQIHLLVVAPRDEVGAKRRRTAGALDGATAMPPPTERIKGIGQPMPLPDAANVQYVSVPAALINKCGLVAPHKDTVLLYVRPQVRALWTFVEQEVIANGARAYIVGPPGTGKSLSTLCYVAQLDRSEWHVVWIHLASPGNSCLSTGTGEFWKDIDLSTFVVPRVDGKRLLVCLDGYKANATHEVFEGKVRRALADNDRLLVCSSMATMGKRNKQDDAYHHILRFYMYSWTLAEYEGAIADAAFYEQVKAKLDAKTDLSDVNVDDSEEEAVREVTSTLDAATILSAVNVDGGKGKARDPEEEKKKRALDRKFYYAGGSCRFMFQCATKEVKVDLHLALENTLDKTLLVTYCSGSLHHDTVNTLYGMAEGEYGGERFPVSSYAAALFAKASGKEVIAELASRLNSSKNPAINGHLMEWLFLASVPRRVVELVGNNDKPDKLPQAPVLKFDPKKRFAVLPSGRLKGDKKWLQPVAWNQGGYDAVYFDQDQGRVMFVQVMRSKTHSFKMRFFHEVLLKLQKAGMQIQTVDVYFVVKSAQHLKFQIGDVEDRHHLEQFDAKWTRPEEKHVKVRAFVAVGLRQ